jgi:SAM-dependent methyltransferase
MSPAEYRSVWESKPTLRVVYADLFQRIADVRLPGLTFEIGGGSGNLRETIPDVLSADISHSRWLDLVADAQRLPLVSGTVDNLVGFDVLHHIEFPVLLFQEASRVLRPGGRLIFVEPAITPVSWPFYRFLHPEPVDLRADPLAEGLPDPDRRPFESNQAIPTLLATRHRRRLAERHPELALVTVHRMSLVAYPLSGGFQAWTLTPLRLLPWMLRVERHLEGWLGRLMAFRMLMVFEKAIKRG